MLVPELAPIVGSSYDSMQRVLVYDDIMAMTE